MALDSFPAPRIASRTHRSNVNRSSWQTFAGARLTELPQFGALNQRSWLGA